MIFLTISKVIASFFLLNLTVCEASVLLNTTDRVLGSRQDVFNKNLLKWIGIILGVVMAFVIAAACMYQHKRAAVNPLEALRSQQSKDNQKHFDVSKGMVTDYSH
jgi:hypothetical protein